MRQSFATASEEDGVGVTSADVGGLSLSELRFPRLYDQLPFEPPHPYLAIVLEGAVAKSFRARTVELRPARAVVMPAGATHGARFGADGARILIVALRSVDDPIAGCFARLAELGGPELSWLAWRLAAELRAADTAAPLAAEGLALELLAAAAREPLVDRAPRWLRAAEELLRDRVHDHLGLGELAEAVGVQPGRLARAFRLHYGLTVGEYGRRLRLAWAAKALAETDAPLAEIATSAGFADQSHFTRVFKQQVGSTPARYRARTFHAR